MPILIINISRSMFWERPAATYFREKSSLNDNNCQLAWMKLPPPRTADLYKQFFFSPHVILLKFSAFSHIFGKYQALVQKQTCYEINGKVAKAVKTTLQHPNLKTERVTICLGKFCSMKCQLLLILRRFPRGVKCLKNKNVNLDNTKTTKSTCLPNIGCPGSEYAICNLDFLS